MKVNEFYLCIITAYFTRGMQKLETKFLMIYLIPWQINWYEYKCLGLLKMIRKTKTWQNQLKKI